MTIFKCWVPDFGHTEEEKHTITEPYLEPDTAAEKYVERFFDAWEYPSSVDVWLQEVDAAGELGPILKYNVEVRSEPVFYAYEIKNAK
jgi:hypothetical protein